MLSGTSWNEDLGARFDICIATRSMSMSQDILLREVHAEDLIS